MTRYDPFAYGEVRLDPNQQQAEADPEDMLFDQGEGVKQAPPADSSWSLLEEDVEGLLPGAQAPAASEMSTTVEFGSEILGEDVGAKPVPAEGLRRPQTGERQPVVNGEAVPKAPPAQRRREVRRSELTVQAERKPLPKKAPIKLPGRRRRPLAAVVVPLALGGSGGCTAWWQWSIESNPVLAGILVAATLVGALFAWLFLRG